MDIDKDNGPDELKEEHRADRTLDVKGFNCPIPVLTAKKEIGQMEDGQVLKIISSDPGSKADMISFAGRYGHEMIDTKESAGELVFLIRINASKGH